MSSRTTGAWAGERGSRIRDTTETGDEIRSGRRTNYFAPSEAATRYAEGRPYFHPVVIERIGAHLDLTERVPRAIDIGCGTGLSTKALAEISDRVVGVDPAYEMLRFAQPSEHAGFLVGAAERLPMRSHTFQLMTLCQVFHWLDQRAFLAEARRTLQKDAHLVIYDNGFRGSDSNSVFDGWMRDEYLREFPTPARVRDRWDEAAWANEGFELLGEERYENRVPFTQEELVQYLMTQSNVIAVVEGGERSATEVRTWLMEELRQLLRETDSTYAFAGPITYLRRSS